MNLYNVSLKFIFVLLLLINISTSTIQIDNLKVTSNKLSIDETNENTIEYASSDIVENKTSTPISIEQDNLLLNSIKKNVDTELSNKQSLNNTLDGNYFKCNETTEFKCKSENKCISKDLLCDGFKDCELDGSDEQDCDKNCSLHNKFQCKSDGKCIDLIFKCNSFPNCAGM